MKMSDAKVSKLNAEISLYPSLLCFSLIQQHLLQSLQATVSPKMTDQIIQMTKDWKIFSLQDGQTDLKFLIRCAYDARMALMTSHSINGPMIEIAIGSWLNSKTTITYHRGDTPNQQLQQPTPLASAVTPCMTCPVTLRSFWVSFKENLIEVGRKTITEGEKVTLLTCKIPPRESNEEGEDISMRFTHFALSTGSGQGDFQFDSNDDEAFEDGEQSDPNSHFYHLPAYWKTMENGLLDSERKKETRPVIAGFDQNGKYIYVGRCEFQNGVWLPGNVQKFEDDYCCFVAVDGAVHMTHNFEVLLRSQYCDLVWVETYDDRIPPGALAGGVDDDNDPIFIGRQIIEIFNTSVGAVYPKRGLCSVSHRGIELLENDHYEVLCVRSLPLISIEYVPSDLPQGIGLLENDDEVLCVRSLPLISMEYVPSDLPQGIGLLENEDEELVLNSISSYLCLLL